MEAESDTLSSSSSPDNNCSFDNSDNRDDDISSESTESVALGDFAVLSRRKNFLIMVKDIYPQAATRMTHEHRLMTVIYIH